MHRPNFTQVWARFLEVNLLVADVGSIGGKVGANLASGVFTNA
jgi:hypothetical protein